MNEEDAKELVLSAIAAGISNDLGSGSNIDVCVITRERGLEHHRGAWKDPGAGSDDAGQRTEGAQIPIYYGEGDLYLYFSISVLRRNYSWTTAF